MGSSASSNSAGRRAHGDGEPLPLATGHRHRVVGGPSRAGRVGRAGQPPRFVGLARCAPGHLGGEGDVLQGRHLLEQPEELEDDRDVPAAQVRQLGAPMPCRGRAGDDSPARRRATRGRPRPTAASTCPSRRADEGDELAARHVEVDAAQRAYRRRHHVVGLAARRAADRTGSASRSAPVRRHGNHGDTISVCPQGDRPPRQGCWHPSRGTTITAANFRS